MIEKPTGKDSLISEASDIVHDSKSFKEEVCRNETDEHLKTRYGFSFGSPRAEDDETDEEDEYHTTNNIKIAHYEVQLFFI